MLFFGKFVELNLIRDLDLCWLLSVLCFVLLFGRGKWRRGWQGEGTQVVGVKQEGEWMLVEAIRRGFVKGKVCELIGSGDWQHMGEN